MDAQYDPRVASLKVSEEVRSEVDGTVHARRKQAGIAVSGDTWGLALSGGGIRSATFCLGLVRGLAKNGLLKRFDYLSTVSGGGYLGSSLGRLYREKTTAAEVEAGVARDDSMWLWWLRNNGRYLTPAGAKDLGYATASILRGIVSTHLEIAVLILAAALLVLLPHVLVALFPPLRDDTWWNYDLVSVMPSVWGWLLVLPVWGCVHQVCAYWYTREAPSKTSTALITLAAAIGSWLFWVALQTARQASGADMALYGILAILATGPVTAWFSSVAERLKRRSAGAQRLMRTKRLSYCLWAIAIGMGLLLLDWCTWQLTRLYWGRNLTGLQYKISATVLILVAAARVLVPELQRWMATTKGRSLNLEKLLNIVGIALSVLLAVVWTTVLNAALFPATERETYWEVTWSGLVAIWPVTTFTVVLVACAVYLITTRRSFDLLNLASLHNFYRARIERAYVSSGNSGGENSRFPASALGAVDPAWTSRVAPLTEAIAGDDVDLAAYRPHDHGGPIHLINCCINQSVDDRTGLYNADRKGVALAVSGLGVETGTRLPGKAAIAPTGTVSQWVAISGAAASTGMGSRTSPGLAALLFMSGIRLGYWTPALDTGHRGSDVDDAKEASAPSRRPSRLLRWAPKPLAIVAESIARFPGLFSPVWYVSDGGHFDNTGIYALLKRRVRVIVAADCGADPNYLFGDLESLVRKAKIDYGATIEFVDTGKVPSLGDLSDIVGTPETIGPEAGSRWLVIGRIAYADGTQGVLLVVKPRRLDKMPFDMVAYADRHPDYPQQTTGDQFFDEAQWESYHQLGLLMGERLTADSIERAAGISGAAVIGSSLQEAEKQAVRTENTVSRRERVGMTVRASVGAGLSLSVLVAAWQGIEQFRESRRADERRYEALTLELMQKVREQPIASLYKQQFEQFAKESDARGDDRFDALRDRLNARCEEATSAQDKQACLSLHHSISADPVPPPPFYDYWFADKHTRLIEARTTTTVVAHPDSPPVPPPTFPLPWPPGASASTSDRIDHYSILASTSRNPLAVTEPAEAPIPIATAAPCAEKARVFIHVYDEESRTPATQLAMALQEAVGVSTTPIENVVATAQRTGGRTPYVWSSPAIVTNTATSDACIARARKAFAIEVRIQKIGYGVPDTIEIWIPPRTTEAIAVTPKAP